MAATVVRGAQVKDGSIGRVDCDVSTVGQAVLVKAIQGTGITLSSTGADAGTGDVTISRATMDGLPTGGSAGQILVKNSGTNYDASFVTDIVNNCSLAQQTFGATIQYVTGSDITVPAGSWTVGSKYYCGFDVTKTAAGVAGINIAVKMGTLGTVSDTSRANFSFNPQTAVADSGMIEVWVVFRVVGGSGIISILGRLTHTLASIGLANQNMSHSFATAAAFNMTTLTKIGVAITGGTSFSATCEQVQTQYVQA